MQRSHHEFEFCVADGAGEDWAKGQAHTELQFVTQLIEKLFLEINTNGLPNAIAKLLCNAKKIHPAKCVCVFTVCEFSHADTHKCGEDNFFP